MVSLPNDPLFRPLMAFLSLKPSINLKTVPEFFKLFFSSSTKFFREERRWIIRLCGDATIEPMDYEILEKL